MLNKAQIFTGLALSVSLAAIAVAPVGAQQIRTQPLSARENVNAMNGHPMLTMLEELDPEAVVIGRVAGDAGGILSVKFVSPRPVTVNDRDYYSVNLPAPNWHVQPGDDIVLAYKDGSWLYVGDAACQMAWLTRLNLKAVPEVTPVAIDWGEDKPVSLPPLQPSQAVEPAFVPEPVQGLW